MAIKTWYLREINVGGINPNRIWWDEGEPETEAYTISGWVVAKTGTGNFRILNNGVELSGGWSTTAQPTNTAPAVDNSYAATAIYTPPTLLNDIESISTLYEYTGVFPAGTWTFTFGMRAQTSAGPSQSGRINIRVFKGLRSGTAWTSVTELTSAALVGTGTGVMTTTTTTNSTVTWSAPAFDLNNEFLIIKTAWEITGAGNANGNDVLFRRGVTTITSPDFKKFRALIDN